MAPPPWDSTNDRYRLSRVFRTSSSEVYLVWDQDECLAQADLHYHAALRIASLTLILQVAFPEDDLEAIVSWLDRELLQSHLSQVERESLHVRIYQGEEMASYELESFSDDELWRWLGDPQKTRGKTTKSRRKRNEPAITRLGGGRLPDRTCGRNR